MAREFEIPGSNGRPGDQEAMAGDVMHSSSGGLLLLCMI
ncbi:hypothetical protein CCACVL1_00401, partial [Corchorus capsularis]